MSVFDNIRPYYDSEVNQALQQMVNHPMMKAIMNFTFEEENEDEWKKQLLKTQSIRDFQINFIYNSIKKVLEKSSEGLTVSGFEKLLPNESYLFISNHRDIILDTSLLNVSLFDYGLVMTASAIGDNLVQKEFLLKLSKLNRNFIVQRNLPPRELLQSSKQLSEYIKKLILNENRSVWIAQREGRTKDGNDFTHSGVLKMLAMAKENQHITHYFKSLKIVPVSISYEYDPTDALKMPQLLAEANDKIYIKEKNEDFINLISGIIGQKKRIHISLGNIIDQKLELLNELDNENKQIKFIAQILDEEIIKNYKLWPTNYIALDILNNTNKNADKYTEQEKNIFERRLEIKLKDNESAKESFLAMYANPVLNQLKINTNAI